MPPTSTTFAQATAVKQLSSHEYLADFPDDWCIGTVPHGGFVTSSFLQVAKSHFKTTLSSQDQPHTITLHLDFLRRTQVGPAIFKVIDAKIGRQTSIIHVSLSQPKSSNTKPPFIAADLREEVVGYITNSNIAKETGATYDTEFELHPPSPPADLVKLRDDNDTYWARQGAMPFAHFRKASQKVHFHFPRHGQVVRSIGDEWISFQNGEKFTNEALGFVADMWPMPVEQYREEKNPYDISQSSAGLRSASKRPATYWYPTLLLNLDIKKALPKEGVEWLFARVRAKQIKNGRMDLEVIIMDETGDIVALSHHVTLVLESSRNTAARSDDKSKI